MNTTQSPTPSSSQNTAPTLEECPICLTEYSPEEVLKCSNGHTSACGYCLSKVVSDTCSICRVSTMTEEEPVNTGTDGIIYYDGEVHPDNPNVRRYGFFDPVRFERFQQTGEW